MVMLASIFEVVFGFVLENCLAILCAFVLLPAVWLASLPFILVIALFRREPYGFAVTDLFASVHEFWLKRGMGFDP